MAHPPSQVESLELKPVLKAEEVPVMVHGTTAAVWPTIGTFDRAHTLTLDDASDDDH